MIQNFKDPSPALKGPPSQRISGVRFKSPSVDDANISLPDSVTDPTLKLPSKPSLPTDFSPNKFDPSKTAGNTSFVDPRTGDIGNVGDLPSSNIDVTGVEANEQLKASSEKLNQIKSSNPVPKAEIPTGERIKQVKIKTPNVNAPSVDKVRQKSIETYL